MIKNKMASKGGALSDIIGDWFLSKLATVGKDRCFSPHWQHINTLLSERKKDRKKILHNLHLEFRLAAPSFVRPSPPPASKIRAPSECSGFVLIYSSRLSEAPRVLVCPHQRLESAVTWRAGKWVSRALSRHAGVRRTDGWTDDKKRMFAAQGGAAEGRCGRKRGGEEGLHKIRGSGWTQK